jgi:hypothetical protein
MSQYLNVSPYLVATYSTFSAFPPSATGGALAVALDTTILYVYEQVAQEWKEIGAATGTVTSVGLTAPSIFTVTGSPVTESGTITLSYSGTALPPSSGGTGVTVLGNFTDGVSDGITITGGTGSVINNVSISQQVANATQNGYLDSTDWSTFNSKGSGTVTSVGLVMPSIFSVSDSPVTSNGNIVVTYSGTALPYNYGGTNATSASAAIAGLLPSYVSGEFLTNNGTNLSWGNAPNPTGITGASPSGTATVTGGPSTSGSVNGGAVTISSASGYSSGTGGSSGALNLDTANANGTGNNAAGGINISAGTSTGTSAGGTVTLTSGTGGVPASGNSGTGGTTNLDGGTGGAGTNGNAGNGGGCTVKGGSGGNSAASSSNNAGTGGQCQIVGGTGGTLGSGGTGTPGNGGAVAITGGSPGSSIGAQGGAVNVSSGNGYSGGGAGGAMTFSTGQGYASAATSYSGGSMTFTVDSSGGNSGGAAMNFTAGTGGAGLTTSGANGGQVNFTGGSGGANSTTSGNGGNIVLQAGVGGNSGTVGSGGVIIFETAATTSATEKFRVSNNGTVYATNSQIQAATAGYGYSVKSGSNCKMGTATLVAGTVTVSNTTVTSNSLIFLTAQSSSGTAGEIYISAKTVSTSFVITSTSSTDTRVVAWLIMEEM